MYRLSDALYKTAEWLRWSLGQCMARRNRSLSYAGDTVKDVSTKNREEIPDVAFLTDDVARRKEGSQMMVDYS